MAPTLATNEMMQARTDVDRRQVLALTGALVAGVGISTAPFGAGPARASADLATRFGSHAAGSTDVVDNALWDAALKAHIVPREDGLNLFDYAAAKRDSHAEIKRYVETLEAVDPSKLDRSEQFAFWANLYNAKTIDVVLDAYPVGSIREITINEGFFGFLKKSTGLGGPWKAKIMKVGGVELSLDDVEHEIMRKVFKDPRIHYSVNCASIGCPNLADRAFTGRDLEAQLDAGARAFINHPRGIDIGTNGSVLASSIYSWFQVDFGGSEVGVLDHVRQYAEPALAAKLAGKTAIARFDYDWALNDV
ncbi:MAG: DUF547 domain-containing protein [Hyphomicrobiaceae bacterium]